MRIENAVHTQVAFITENFIHANFNRGVFVLVNIMCQLDVT